MKTNDYLNQCKKKLNIDADLKLANEIGVTRSVVSRWRKSLQAPDMYSCFRIGEILNIDPKIIIANVKIEVEKDDFKAEFWQEKIKEYGYISPLLLSSINIGGILLYILC